MGMVHLKQDGHVAQLTLDRPEKLNALDKSMLRALEERICTLERSTDVRAVVLGSTGERAFCAGADIRAWSGLEPLDMWRTWMREGHRIFGRLARLRMPVIAAVQGFALGGGLELALAADLRVAADSASFGLPEVSIAAVPGWGGTSRLPALVGAARAKEMIFLGERIDAAKALEWGLVNALVPAARLIPRCLEMAQRIAAHAPVAVQLSKEAIDGSSPAVEIMAGALSAFTEDAREGAASFSERRGPTYRGR